MSAESCKMFVTSKDNAFICRVCEQHVADHQTEYQVDLNELKMKAIRDGLRNSQTN